MRSDSLSGLGRNTSTPSYQDLNSDTEMPINANQLAGSYQEGRRCIKRVCDCLLGDVRDWDGDELELENNGTTLRFYRRRSSGHPTAVVNIHDRDKVGKFLGLEAAYPPLDDDNEFALNPRNLLKIYRGHPSTIQELCNENFGNLSSWDTGVRVVGNDELNIEVFRRNDLGGPTAAVKKTDLNKFAHLFELNRRYRLLNDEAEFGFYAENLFMHYTNHAQLRDLCDRIVGDIDLWDSDVRDITYEGVTCRFYRRQVATGQAVAAIKKSDLTKLEELYQLNKLYPLIDDKETPVNRNQLKMRYREEKKRNFKKLLAETIGDVRQWECDVKEITGNGVRVKFFRRSFGGGDTAAIKVEDERDLETLFKLKTRYPELDKKTEFAVNGGNLSNNLGYEGSPMALKARCDDLTGDIDSWVADECDFTGNGVTVTLYRRTKSCISTAVAKKCDKAKVEKLLGLQLKKKRKANLNEEMIIRAAKEFYRIHGRFPHAGSKEPVPNLDETWSSISSACHCGGRGLIKGRTLSKILKPVRSSLGQGLTNKRLPRKFQAATEQAREFAARSSKKAVRSHLSLDKSRNVNYLKGDCFEQVVGLLLLSRFPKEKVIPQYCLVVDPKRAYYGMRADYAVTRRDGERDIYEVKWGNATDNIKETAEKHRGALGLKQSNYHMIFLEPNSKVREDYALFANLNQGLQTSPDLAKLIEQIKDQVEANNGEGLEAMRDYLYGLVIKANSFNGDDRIKFIQEELGGLYASDDAGNYMKEHSYALYASLEAYVEYEGKLCRELICPKALVKEEPDVYSLNYQLGDLCFENLCDLDLAVKIEMSGCDDSQSLNVDDLVPEDEKQFDKAIFTLPSGETISCHEDLSPDHLVRSPDEAKEVLDFNDGNFEFAESFIESYS